MIRAIGMVLTVAVLSAAPDSALAGEARVSFHEGLVTATFDTVPAAEALAAIRRATGVEVVVPVSVQGKTLTLTVTQLPFERFLRRVLEALDLGGFALVYEPGGAAGRLIVVDRARGRGPAAGEKTGAPAPGTAATGGTTPIYIPSREPPVYIPPREPPVYIPPTTEPVYIPPATEPRYVPPSGQ